MNENSEQALKAICRYLSKQHVVTLCVTEDDGFPWCASCFYAFDAESMSLLLMTEATTRHGRAALNDERTAGAITAQTRNVLLIQGIQYRGRLTLLEGEEAQRARALYLKRFPIARMASAPLWRLSLDEVKMTDNRAGFGAKRLWRRAPQASGPVSVE
ncbi:YhbP family protein [Leminorella grimontii]|uniref:YhbP family protein n=1 Tax=Leminorella grimontii TaxID=82981 RepID=UPI00321FB0B7